MEVASDHGITLDRAVAALRLDAAGRIVDVTPEAATVLGFRPQDLHGLALRDLAAEQWSAVAESATVRILAGDAGPFQLMLRGRSGRRTLVEIVSRPVEESGEASYVLAWSEQSPVRAFESTGSSAPELRRLANGLLRMRERNKAVMDDPQLKEHMDPSKMPFDGKRMFWGGFETVIGLAAGG